jgi:hypothetical protein
MEDNADVGMNVGEAPEVIEKSLTTSQVNDIVKREKLRAAERARQEMQAQHQAELEKLRAESSKAPEAPGIDQDALRKQVLDDLMMDLQAKAEKAEHDKAMAELQNIADQYHLKMKKGSDLFEDFNEVTADFEADKFSPVVMLAAQLENTPEIIYELTRNPSKLAEIDTIAQRSPKLAMKMLEKLSGSIKQNQEAKLNNVSAPAPLSHLKSSTVGADSGKMTLKDLKKMPYLRG